MGESRTKNSTRNILIAIITMGISFIVTFAYRWFFLRILTVEYLGVSGLFSSIINILSLTELGFSSAVMFSLFKPIADNDEHKIAAILRYYRRIYYVVAVTVLAIGLALMPFLKYLIQDAPAVNPNIYIMYAFVLGGSVCSYFNSYKFTMLLVDQKEYITKIVFFLCKLFVQIIQIIFLFVFKNYYVVLATDLLMIILQNVILTIIVNKKYPYLRKLKDKLQKEERSTINQYSGAMMVHKIGGVMLTSADALVITPILGTIVMGLSSNYSTISAALNAVINAIFSGLLASVGNFNYTKEKEDQFKLYKTTTLMGTWFAMFIALGFGFVVQDFMKVWLGNEYLLDNFTIIAMALALFAENYARAIGVFNTTMGLFKKSAPVSIVFAVLKIGISIGLVYWIGLPGIFLGTFITRCLILPVDIWIVNHFGFDIKARRFYSQAVKQLLVVTVATLLTYFACLIKINNTILSVIYKTGVVCLIPNALYLLAFYRSEEIQPILNRVKSLIGRGKKNKGATEVDIKVDDEPSQDDEGEVIENQNIDNNQANQVGENSTVERQDVDNSPNQENIKSQPVEVGDNTNAIVDDDGHSKDEEQSHSKEDETDGKQGR